MTTDNISKADAWFTKELNLPFLQYRYKGELQYYYFLLRFSYGCLRFIRIFIGIINLRRIINFLTSPMGRYDDDGQRWKVGTNPKWTRGNYLGFKSWNKWSFLTFILWFLLRVLSLVELYEIKSFIISSLMRRNYCSWVLISYSNVMKTEGEFTTRYYNMWGRNVSVRCNAVY